MKSTLPLSLILSVLITVTAPAAVTIDTTTSGFSANYAFGTAGEYINGKDDNGNGLTDENIPLTLNHTFGQVFAVPLENPVMSDFTFFYKDSLFVSVGEPDHEMRFSAYVMAWDSLNQRATGSTLYLSGLQIAPQDGTTHPYAFTGLNLTLIPGNSYVAFLTQENFQTGSGNNSFSFAETRDTDAYGGGTLVTKTGGTLDFTGLTTEAWSATAGQDASFQATFAVPEPQSLLLSAMGLVILATLRKRLVSCA